MAGRLVLASMLTVFLLLSMVGLLFAAIMYFFGGAPLPVVIAFTVLFNVLAFFVSPWVQDALLCWLYNARIYTVDEFRQIAPEISDIIEEVSREHGFRPPRIVYIPDRNPTAFTYGSTRSAARIAI
ncbi:TPA: peptidase M48, partial [Candidatus Micrarchaeota archaeon]|nr:peptidase M48 [Candidatus Micrarchaeota archaeon]